MSNQPENKGTENSSTVIHLFLSHHLRGDTATFQLRIMTQWSRERTGLSGWIGAVAGKVVNLKKHSDTDRSQSLPSPNRINALIEGLANCL